MKENNLKDLFKYALEQDTKVRRGIIYSILNKIFDLAPPILIGIAIDIVVEGSDSFIGNLGYSDRRQQLIILAVLTFIIWGLESAFDYIAAVTWRNISQDIEHSLRTDAFNNVLGLDLAFFENKEGKINHVGIIMKNNYIIHASGKVRIDKLDKQGIFNDDFSTHSHKLGLIKSIV